MLSHLSCEIKKSEIFHPVIVIDELGLVRFVAIEVEKLRHLLLDSFLVVVESLGVKQVSLLALTRRVANHACCSAHKQIGFVAATLQMAQHHDATEVTDMERIGRGVSSQVG